MRNPRRSIPVITIAIVGMLLFALPAVAQERTFEVTITNVTRGQIVSPPLVVAHDDSISLFTPGEAASEPLAQIAEDAVYGPMLDLLESSDAVSGYAMGGGPLLPGASMTLELTASGDNGRISAIGMLVTTNDAFFGFETIEPPNVVLPMGGPVPFDFEANAYDAGSEANTESCEHIPGPPCGNPGVRVTDGAEGYVHVHAGVHGLADLVPADHDWRNPVVEISIEHVN
jgi:hypothetical protein